MKLSELKAKTRRVVAQYGDDEIVFEYRPGMVTPEMVLSLQGVADNSGVAEIVEFLASVIARWEIEADDGSPWPVKVENLLQLPVSLLGAMLTTIIEDAQPNPTKRAN